jgi:hypothetical protein
MDQERWVYRRTGLPTKRKTRHSEEQCEDFSASVCKLDQGILQIYRATWQRPRGRVDRGPWPHGPKHAEVRPLPTGSVVSTAVTAVPHLESKVSGGCLATLIRQAKGTGRATRRRSGESADASESETCRELTKANFATEAGPISFGCTGRCDSGSEKCFELTWLMRSVRHHLAMSDN